MDHKRIMQMVYMIGEMDSNKGDKHIKIAFKETTFITSYGTAVQIINKSNGIVNIEWQGQNIIKSTGANSGIIIGDAKKNLIITGGEVQAINTNKTNSYISETQLIGIGLYSDAEIDVRGGHIVAQGISQAIKSVNTKINNEQTVTDGVIKVVASEDYDHTSLEEYDSKKIYISI